MVPDERSSPPWRRRQLRLTIADNPRDSENLTGRHFQVNIVKAVARKFGGDEYRSQSDAYVLGRKLRGEGRVRRSN